VLSVVDTAQIALTDASAGPVPPHLPLSAGQLYSTIVLKLPYGNYRLGVFDPTVMAAIGMHRFRRHAEVKVLLSGIAIALVCRVPDTARQPRSPTAGPISADGVARVRALGAGTVATVNDRRGPLVQGVARLGIPVRHTVL